jgi:malonate transporter and related proteins
VSGIGEGFLVIGVIVVVGYLVGRAGVLGEDATGVLSKAAFWVGTPALLFQTLSTTPTGTVFAWPLVVVACSAAAVCLLYVPAALWRRRPGGEVVIGSMAAGYVNAGNLGLPIASYAMGNAAAVAPALIFQLALLTPVYTTILDVVAARARGERPSWLWTLSAPTRNPLAIATALGVLVSALGVDLPGAVTEPVGLAARLAVPAMLLAFGLSLVTARRPGRDEDAPLLFWVVGLKCLVMPALGITGAWLLDLGPAETLAIAISTALPTAQNVFGYAVRFAQGVSLARDAALVSTIVSVPVLFGVVALVG